MGCFHQSPATFPVGGQIPVGFALTVLAAVVSDFKKNCRIFCCHVDSDFGC